MISNSDIKDIMENYHVNITPEDVEGYTPHIVPTLAPQALEGPSAKALTTRLLIISLIMLTVGIVILSISSWWLPIFITLPLAVVIFAVIFVKTFAFSSKIGDKALKEFEQGYTTLKIQPTSFWFGKGKYDVREELKMKWDYSPLWYLESATGDVLRYPGEGIAPGMYFSPHEPGSLELWTGEQWAGRFVKKSN